MRVRVFLLLLLVLATVTIAQTPDPLIQADDAFRKGDFRQAAKLYAAAAETITDADKRAEIRAQLAWTYFGMKNKTKAEEAIAAALRDNPNLDLVPDYYTDDFLALFKKVKQRPATTPTPPPPLATAKPAASTGTLIQIRQRISQTTDNATLEGVLADIAQLEITSPPATLPEVLETKAGLLERLGRSGEAYETRGRVGALKSVAQTTAGVSPTPLDTLREARSLLANRRPEDTVALMRGVLGVLPACVPAFEIMGEALADAGKLEEAESTLKTALMAQERPETLLILGEVRQRMNNMGDARATFKRVTELDLGNDRAWAALGLIALRLEDTAAARDALDKALRANGTLFEARVARAQIALLDKDYALAQQHLQKALQVRPDDPWASGWYGVSCLWSGNAALAVERLKVASQLNDRGFNIALAEALRRQGYADEALLSLATAKSDDFTAALLRGRCLLDANKPTEAQQQLAELVRMQPRDGQAHYLLGCAYHALRNWSEATKEFKLAATLPGAPPEAPLAASVAEATLKAQALLDQAVTPPPPPKKK